jgi:hypothetical protein
MTKQEAIAKINEVQSGSGVDRDAYLAVFAHSELSRRYWNDGDFTLGIEYGYLIALIEVFQITREDMSP